MGMATAILSAVSVGAQLFTSSQQASAASQAGQAQANASYYNAAVQRNNAIAAQQAAAFNAKQQRKINLAREAKLEAGLLHSGVLLEGTPLLLLEDAAKEGGLEEAKIIHTGEVQASGAQAQAGLDTFSARSAQAAGETRASGLLTSGIFGAVGTAGSALLRN